MWRKRDEGEGVKMFKFTSTYFVDESKALLTTETIDPQSFYTHHFHIRVKLTCELRIINDIMKKA